MVRVYGLIGRNISHSFSAGFFNDKFKRENIEAIYKLFDLQDIKQIKSLLTSENIYGLNVTAPYKREVIPFLDSVSSVAEELNAVNVIKVMRNNVGEITLIGDNADYEGFRQTLPASFNKDIKALVLGTGGAASAVCKALDIQGISFRVVSRYPKKDEVSYETANSFLPDSLLIVNATPLGMPHLLNEAPPIDYSLITPHHYCYDLIYNPSETLFLKKAKGHGAKIINGLEMLVNQANISWNIWNQR